METLAKVFETSDPETVARVMSDLIGRFVMEAELSADPLVAGLMAGNTVAQTLGLTAEDLDAIYRLGHQLLIQGDGPGAQTVFFQLVRMDPLEARHHYCLGLSFQMQQRAGLALEAFTNFLALDATNPDGYLRLGECFLATGEPGLALEAFQCAEAEAVKGNGDDISLTEARARIALLDME